MGQKALTQSGAVYKLPDLSREHQRELSALPKHYHQTELFPKQKKDPSQRPELLSQAEFEKKPKQYLKGDLEALEHTELFEPNLIKHIFNGEVKLASAGKGKKRLETTGYHTEVIKNAEGQIVPGTKSAPDAKGIYQGKVTVKGIRKRTMGGMSTFFPAHWSPQHVVDALNEAYMNKTAIEPSSKIFYGYSKEGIRIKIRISPNGKISSAFPTMEDN